MIRDTFETNPGLRELFKRKMLERARFVGLNEDLIDFEAQIDLKGTYHDNLRTFYREYPQLAEDSDYFRIKSIQPLSGAALEQSWRSYEGNNVHETPGLRRKPTEEPRDARAITPELVVTYTVGGRSVMGRKEASKEPEPLSTKSGIQGDADPAASTHGELANLILDRVTAIAGKKVTQQILHQIGQELGKTVFNNSRDQIPPDKPVEALDLALRKRGWGRAIAVRKAEHESSVTYMCTVEGRFLLRKRESTSPTCDIMRGIVSRWLESFVQKNAECIETACVSAGSHLCVFRVTFRN